MCFSNVFFCVYSVIHYDDWSTRKERKTMDKFCHIREIFEHVVDNFQNYYTPSECMTIDEQLLAFRGRCSFKQYIPSKPAKYGIKTWAMVDANTFYVYNLETYLGKPNSLRYKVSNKPEDVVLRLVKPIENTGRNVTADNWFTSIPLVKEMANKKLSFVGTIRKNKRELPFQFKPDRKREIESSLFGFHQISENLDISLVSYVSKYNKAVILVSTLYDKPEIDASSKKKKPKIITFYNEDKCGVDVVDQMCANYNCRRRTKRWPNIVMFNLINLCDINAFVQYNDGKGIGNPQIRYNFLQKVAFELIKPLIEKRLVFKQIPIEARKRGATLCGQTLEEEPSEAFGLLDRSGPPADKPQKGCALCSKYKNCRMCCAKCRDYVCSKHSYIICDDCVSKKN